MSSLEKDLTVIFAAVVWVKLHPQMTKDQKDEAFKFCNRYLDCSHPGDIVAAASAVAAEQNQDLGYNISDATLTQHDDDEEEIPPLISADDSLSSIAYDRKDDVAPFFWTAEMAKVAQRDISDSEIELVDNDAACDEQDIVEPSDLEDEGYSMDATAL